MMHRNYIEKCLLDQSSKGMKKVLHLGSNNEVQIILYFVWFISFLVGVDQFFIIFAKSPYPISDPAHQ